MCVVKRTKYSRITVQELYTVYRPLCTPKSSNKTPKFYSVEGLTNKISEVLIHSQLVDDPDLAHMYAFNFAMFIRFNVLRIGHSSAIGIYFVGGVSLLG
jgi:hypothetical protein